MGAVAVTDLVATGPLSPGEIQGIDRGVEQGLVPGEDVQATPACVNVCPVGARVFGDIKNPESKLSQYLDANDTFRLREDFGTEPKVHSVRLESEV
ncbi:MAG: hypothetical protein DWQ07_18605 [Chloroflexi bacterium]|nr:MAG: hypothetical protein DWQ07_18605 [Chloroflexota bacterium]MBL1194943.1 hypothetical protein [Chloroflexota bacterium]